MIWDTHAHLDDKRYRGELPDVLSHAQEAGVKRILNVGYDVPSSERSVKLAGEYDFIFAAVGVHPHDAAGVSNSTWDTLLGLSKNPKVLAWGEIGLDYYRDLSPRSAQKEVFIQQIELANDHALPIIIHNRDAHQDILQIVQDHPPKYGGVFHCYSGSWEMAKVLLKLGFYLSFAGPVTYKNARHTVEVAKEVPLDRFLVETDSPYLTPEPWRGKRNEPAHVTEVVKMIAALRNQEFVAIAEQAAANAERLFQQHR